VTESNAPGTTTGRWDPLIAELHRLRERSGMPSYDTLARKLMMQRMAEGQDEHAARIAKSSVHDAFRFGRSRINEPLVRELVRVMGGDADLVGEWVRRCSPPSAGSPLPSVPAAAATRDPITPRTALVILVGCLALNLLGREFVDFFRLPVYLDMAGTAVAAIALGPWRGAGVGLATNLIGVIGSGWISLPFALVNVVGALIWGYGVRRWGMGRTLPRFFALNAVTALACSCVAVPIILAFLNHQAGVGHDAITEVIHRSIHDFVVAAGFANVVTSLGDKLVSGFAALVVISMLPTPVRDRIELVGVADAGRAGSAQVLPH
jgi:energy-coupling factor transport system substrate-specific component